MKHTTTTSILSGTNESPIGGQFIISTNRDFVIRNVTVGVSVLTNKTTENSGVVTSVSATQVNAPVAFTPGDFFEVTLSTPWTLQTTNGVVIEVECNRCGWSYPSKELVRGLCKTCVDVPRPI